MENLKKLAGIKRLLNLSQKRMIAGLRGRVRPCNFVEGGKSYKEEGLKITAVTT